MKTAGPLPSAPSCSTGTDRDDPPAPAGAMPLVCNFCGASAHGLAAGWRQAGDVVICGDCQSGFRGALEEIAG